MSGRVSRPPRAAYCEDFVDETNTTLPETRRSANVAAKRSKPDLPKIKPTETADGASDSGYSSRTAATVGSGDSAQSGKRSSPTLRVDTSTKERKSRPPITERKSDHTHRSSSHSEPHRSPSKSRKRESIPNGQLLFDQRGRPVMTPIETTWRVDYPPFNYAPPQAYDTSHMNPQPQSARYPPPQMWPQEIHTPQQTNPRPRMNSSHSYQRPPRPMTIHGGIMQEMVYMAIPQRSPYDHGLPPSAYVNAPFSYPPTSAAYAAAPASAPTPAPAPASAPAPAPVPVQQRGRSETQPPPSPYHEPRSRHRTEQPPTNRRSSMYGPPVVDYAQPGGGPSLERKFSTHREQWPPKPTRSFERDEDYYRMPPPPPPQVIPLKTRPSVRKSATLNSTPTVRRSSKDSDDTRAEVSDRIHRDDGNPDATRRRPSLDPMQGKKYTSYPNGANSVRVSSGAGGGVLSRSKTYHGRQDLEQKQREVEEYQHAKGGKPVPLTADSLKHIRPSHKSGSESESQSRTSSSRSASDVKTRSGTVSRGESDNFFIDVNGVKLGFSKESMSGRTIRVSNPNPEDGTMDIQIGGKGGKHHIVSDDDTVRYREIDDGRKTRDESKDRTSRRTSRSGTSDRGSVK